MKKRMVVFVFLIASLSPGFAQNRMDAATRQDVADLMELTRAGMAGQFAAGFATRYQQPYPQPQPENEAQIEKPAADTSQPALTRPQ